MKNLLLFLSVILLLSSQISTAQTDQLILLENDLIKVAENFATPGAEGAALQSSAGWFTSGQSLDKWKFEVSVHGNALFVPSGKQKKLSSNRDFDLIRFSGSDNALLPTIYGGKTNAMFEFDFQNPISGNTETYEFETIDGLGKDLIFHPYPQVTMGLPYSTEVAIRYLPSVIINDVGFSTYGIGFKHNFTQYFERKFDPRDFQFAAVATYSNFKVDYGFNELTLPGIVDLNRIDVNADLWMFQVLGSKLYDTFEVFGALGLTSSNFDYKLHGTGLLLPRLNDSLGRIEGSGTKFKGDVGFNYYFSNFKISTMFTASNFFNANLGIHYRI